MSVVLAILCRVCSDTVLDASSGIAEVGEVKWELTLCSLLGWILVYAVLCIGIQSLGKVCASVACSFRLRPR
jgi:hypothetical protein